MSHQPEGLQRRATNSWFKWTRTLVLRVWLSLLSPRTPSTKRRDPRKSLRFSWKNEELNSQFLRKSTSMALTLTRCSNSWGGKPLSCKVVIRESNKFRGVGENSWWMNTAKLWSSTRLHSFQKKSSQESKGCYEFKDIKCEDRTKWRTCSKSKWAVFGIFNKRQHILKIINQ